MRNVDLRPQRAFVKAYGHNGYFKSLEVLDGRDQVIVCREGDRDLELPAVLRRR